MCVCLICDGLVAATGVPVVAVSSPGIYLSSKGFDVPAEPLSYLETNLIAEGDLIPKIDMLQVGTRHGDTGFVMEGGRREGDACQVGVVGGLEGRGGWSASVRECGG